MSKNTSLPRETPKGEFPVPVVQLRRRQAPYLHPWVFRRMVKTRPVGVPDGAEVVVSAADGTPLGRGFFHASSTICVRILTQDAGETLDAGFLRRRIGAAVSFRREVLDLERSTNAYRVVHSEGDGLSGLVVDRYRDLLVVEIFSKAFLDRRKLVRDALLDAFPEATVLFRVDLPSAQRERMELPETERSRVDAAGEVEIREGKMRFVVSPAGHKTGFFLDQRENRERFTKLVRGRKVLDAFCYTGSFAIAARTLGKAAKVVAVDLDEDALQIARRNAALNRAPIEWIHEDALRFLRHQRHAVEPFQAIVVDPPKWVASRAETERAERMYLDLNTYACRAVAPGGLLLTCSCSGLLSEARFLQLIARAAARAGRQVQVFHVAGAAADHPVSIHCPESRYLSAVFARVG